MSTATFTTRLLVACLVSCVTSCWTPPGKGRKAEAGYRAAVPVIAALEKFHEERGHYPADLGELVPTHLMDTKALRVRGKATLVYSPRTPAPDPQQAYSRFDEFGYHRHGDTYRRSFSYTGPGMNHCWYDSKTRQWIARGYY